MYACGLHVLVVYIGGRSILKGQGSVTFRVQSEFMKHSGVEEAMMNNRLKTVDGRQSSNEAKF